ncbi:YqjF family protein [Flavobacterium sp. 2]|uniref:YqjF family protein n=1 Tax=Flavobacterium sp. 2 TaxID=308053 RepID=UPI003CF723F8
MYKIEEILLNTRNREYPLPEKKWKYYQEWHKTLFFHWELPAYFLQDYIPKGIELDTFHNMAWVSLVIFEVKNMRLRNLPPFPFISHFPEINLRTYVIKDGKPGIYMFSIETNKLIEVLFTRMFIGLPYQKSKIKRSPNRLRSQNKTLKQHLDVNIGKIKPLAEKTPLDFWLTERHSLYENCDEEICRSDIHHKEWVLKELDVTINDINYNAGKYSVNTFPDKIQYSEKIDVLLWGKEKV